MANKWDVRKVKWVIPNKYPLESKGQCMELLGLGYTLINNAGYTVHLAPEGYQVMSNKRRTDRNNQYDFSHPFLWQVKSTNHKRIEVLNWNSWWFKFEKKLLQIGNFLF